MIYLIDDKIRRQEDYGWKEEKFLEYQDIIIPIHSFEEYGKEEFIRQVLRGGNVVILHESFIESVDKDLKNQLKEYAEKNENFYLVFFSGSKSSRILKGNIAHIPVEIFYQNFGFFLEELKNGEINLQNLLYGKNKDIEEKLIKKLDEAREQMEDTLIETNNKNIFIASIIGREIEKIFDKEPSMEYFFYDKNDMRITDSYLDEKVKEWFSDEKYDYIFLPLCFGPTMSDFNGLRMALHIRCTDTKNQTTPIGLYGVADYKILLYSRYFDILKTQNVELIGYNKDSFKQAIEKKIKLLHKDDIPKELKKINLPIPNDYLDPHNIANEWALYRWATSLGIRNESLNRLFNKVNTNLYFKYLKTLYPIQRVNNSKKILVNLKKLNLKQRAKVLLIDDESSKGWKFIFKEIFKYVKNSTFNSFDNFSTTGTTADLIQEVKEKVEKEQIDIVILDFRLHQSDFITKSITEITGYKLLKEIKNINPGIQVIVFSATNKVWNLQALQKTGADGFILKESVENASLENFTELIIENFYETIELAFKKSFLKNFYESYFRIKSLLEPRKNYDKAEDPLDKNFVDEVLKLLEGGNNILVKGNLSDEDKILAFLMYFMVIENISNYLIDIENPEKNKDKYHFKFRKSEQYLMFFKEGEKGYEKTKERLESKRSLPWIQKLLNTVDYLNVSGGDISKISSLVQKRNNIIHANTLTGGKISIEVEDLINLYGLIMDCLENI